jgi:DNA-binding transcriptional MerR regulator
MYRIGQFSQITKVTVKALRFYEEEGLIEPRYVDPVNGYRYYGSDQLPRMYRIVSLRQCGFSIPEIRCNLGGRNLPSIFAERKRQLEERAVKRPGPAGVHLHYCESLNGGNGMEIHLVMKELPG